MDEKMRDGPRMALLSWMMNKPQKKWRMQPWKRELPIGNDGGNGVLNLPPSRTAEDDDDDASRAREWSVSGKKRRSTLKAFLEPPLSRPVPAPQSPAPRSAHAPSFSVTSLTAPFPLTQFSACSAPFSAPLTRSTYSPLLSCRICSPK